MSRLQQNARKEGNIKNLSKIKRHKGIFLNTEKCWELSSNKNCKKLSHVNSLAIYELTEKFKYSFYSLYADKIRVQKRKPNYTPFYPFVSPDHASFCKRHIAYI